VVRRRAVYDRIPAPRFCIGVCAHFEWYGTWKSTLLAGDIDYYYVTLVGYTHQGISKIKNSPSRLDAAKKAAEAEGGKIHTWYLTMGQYDAVLISEFPSDEACAKFALSAGALGNISTETSKAFEEAAYRKIIGSLR
jgi:uncharacterized protein with GYD domain